jgi:hypothetical protein
MMYRIRAMNIAIAEQKNPAVYRAKRYQLTEGGVKLFDAVRVIEAMVPSQDIDKRKAAVVVINSDIVEIDEISEGEEE